MPVRRGGGGTEARVGPRRAGHSRVSAPPPPYRGLWVGERALAAGHGGTSGGPVESVTEGTRSDTERYASLSQLSLSHPPPGKP